jgi:hypothetical protein
MPQGSVLLVWILLVIAVLLDIAAFIWGSVLSVVLLSVGVLVAAGALKLGGKS